MALLVTGAMGHVGLEVVRQAVARGHDVVALYRNTFRAADAESIGPKAKFVRADVENPAAVAALADTHAIDGAIHTAAVPNENYARPDPVTAMRTNVAAVAYLLDQARLKRWRRFIAVSTGSVFQDATDVTKLVLEDRPTFATNVYSTTKLCAEMLTTMYRTQYEVPAASVRISWVYGPPLVPRVRENPRGLIPWFLKCALEGVPVKEPTGADFQASFTYVSDVAAGLIAAYEAKSLNHQVYHLGSGRNYTTGEVVAAIEKAVPGARFEVGPGPQPWTGHTSMRGPLAGSRLAEDAGFRPSFSLDAGVAAFAEWMRAHPEQWH